MPRVSCSSSESFLPPAISCFPHSPCLISQGTLSSPRLPICCQQLIFFFSKYVLQTAGFGGQFQTTNHPNFIIDKIPSYFSPVPQHQPDQALVRLIRLYSWSITLTTSTASRTTPITSSVLRQRARNSHPASNSSVPTTLSAPVVHHFLSFFLIFSLTCPVSSPLFPVSDEWVRPPADSFTNAIYLTSHLPDWQMGRAARERYLPCLA